MKPKIRWVHVLLYLLVFVVAFFAGRSIAKPFHGALHEQAPQQDSIVTYWQKETISAWALVQATVIALENRKDECDRAKNWQMCSWEFRDLQLRLYASVLLHMPPEFQSDSDVVKRRMMRGPQVPTYPTLLTW